MMLYEQVELKKMIAYIGIDVGKQFLDICYMSSNTTTKLKSKQFNNQKATLKIFVAGSRSFLYLPVRS